ncbi:type VI secretion system lipoprotein TssJ [Pseudomonas turukhanskensis]|uniref:Type VI secretion system protein VasD n=1 Tax=Pseudomonas turukhanskensis TaxID=1806536 RepID=A0A9W6K5K2_9PSED|nr:type VI secretion system lipoprotein TssJ [Pseudomonas turukhanskensis]GLK89272.1 type VI secretion system protein VasD [Pseudomonas turukhanskensis]
MSLTVFNAALWLLVCLQLTACGLAQTVGDASAATAKALFYKQVNTLHLDFTGRAALNTYMTDMNALSVTTLVRVYQLRDSQLMQRAAYESLLDDGSTVLAADLLGEHAVVIKPGEGARLDVPLAEDARFVAVVALFRQPDLRAHSWRLIVPREALHPDRARVVELADNRLVLRRLAED